MGTGHGYALLVDYRMMREKQRVKGALTLKILVVDLGNSFTKIGCFQDGILVSNAAISTCKEDWHRYQEEIKACITDGPFVDCDGIILSSVVPRGRAALEELISSGILPSKAIWLERERFASLRLGGIDLSRYAPGELGADRIANIVGGYALFPNENLCICDFGTTTTFDLVDQTGLFLGGAISPGPGRFQSLVDSRHAAELFQVNLFQAPDETPGRSTRTSLQNGLYYGYKGLMLGILGTLLKEADWALPETRLLFTGGFAQNLVEMAAPELQDVTVDHQLTLKGLFQIWLLNQTVEIEG